MDVQERANLGVHGLSRPEIGQLPSGCARHERERIDAEDLVAITEHRLPPDQIAEELVELAAQPVGLRNLPFGLLYLHDQVDELAEDLIEGDVAFVASRQRFVGVIDLCRHDLPFSPRGLVGCLRPPF